MYCRPIVPVVNRRDLLAGDLFEIRNAAVGLHLGAEGGQVIGEPALVFQHARKHYQPASTMSCSIRRRFRPKRAAQYLQGVLGVAQDGRVGPKTIAAAEAADHTAVVNELCDRRMAFLKRLSCSCL